MERINGLVQLSRHNANVAFRDTALWSFLHVDIWPVNRLEASLRGEST